jgi:hypothetical protein
MKKILLSLLLGVMIFTSVFFTLGCPKPKDPAQEMTPVPAGGDAGGAGDTGGKTGNEGVLDEGGG